MKSVRPLFRTNHGKVPQCHSAFSDWGGDLLRGKPKPPREEPKASVKYTTVKNPSGIGKQIVLHPEENSGTVPGMISLARSQGKISPHEIESLRLFLIQTLSRNTYKEWLTTFMWDLFTEPDWSESDNHRKYALYVMACFVDFFRPGEINWVTPNFDDMKFVATLLTVLSMTGLRIEEALGLLASDLDFRKRVIRIRRSVYMGILQTTKSRASIADLPMPAALESRLKDFLVSKWRQNETGLLFCNRNGKPYSANKLREKKLHPILDTLKIPRCGFHAIRHGVASELIDSGAPLTVVQAQMRHSDARITLGRYGHVVGDSQRNAVAALAQKIARPELLIPIVDINNSTTVPVN